MDSSDPRLTILKNIPKEIYSLDNIEPNTIHYIDDAPYSQEVKYQYHPMYDLNDIYVYITHTKGNSWYFTVKVRYQGTMHEPKDCPTGFLQDISYKLINYLKLMGLYTDDEIQHK
jgi:hypothetical protein